MESDRNEYHQTTIKMTNGEVTRSKTAIQLKRIIGEPGPKRLRQYNNHNGVEMLQFHVQRGSGRRLIPAILINNIQTKL